jgi:hypothetical protein
MVPLLLVAACVLPYVEANRHWAPATNGLGCTVRLLVPPTPEALAAAKAHIAAPLEPPPDAPLDELALRAAAIEMDLLPPGKSRIYFRGPFETRMDLGTVRQRWVDWARHPPSSAVHRFPDGEWCRAQVKAMEVYRARVRERSVRFPEWADRYAEEDERVCWYIRLYSAVGWGSRDALSIVRDMLEPEEWAMGFLPVFFEQD